MATRPVNIKRKGGGCEVVPGTQHAKKPKPGSVGDTVRFNASQIGQDVRILIVASIFGRGTIVLNSRKGYKEDLPVKSGAPVGEHTYTVKWKTKGCVGASRPRMIID
ncbi:MAG: hypothetical protein O7D34_08195 [Ignavibacteria bacterium]|nr:hypothetical protein [Ignavibacteria bacterium]